MNGIGPYHGPNLISNWPGGWRLPWEGPTKALLAGRGQDCGWQEMTSLVANHSFIVSHPGFGNWAWDTEDQYLLLHLAHSQGREGWARCRPHPVLTPPGPGRWEGGGSVTLVETRWDGGGGGNLFNCSFCTGQQGDPRARDPSKVRDSSGVSTSP